MKSLLQLVDAVLHDMENMCHVVASQDYKTILRRVENEGIAFLTITLPSFGKDFENCLDQGAVSPSDFRGFSRVGELPRFLGGFLELVFDRNSGLIRDEPDIESIRSIRQICLMFAKIEFRSHSEGGVVVHTTPERDRAAIEGYVSCEAEIDPTLSGITPLLGDCIDIVARVLNRDLFSRMSNDIATRGIFHRHGPGSTADRAFGNSKWQLERYSTRLERSFPIYETFSYSVEDSNRLYGAVDFDEPGAELPVKVTLVPKTQKTPRIIAQEPSYVQFAQQGLLELFETHLKQVDYLRLMVSLDDQIPNREMARMGSLTGELATLDLSEASDRVSFALVERIFKWNAPLWRSLQDSRSTRAELPDGSILTLRKFASMGSSTCFPVEAICFFVVIIASIMETEIRAGRLHGLSTASADALIKGLKHKVRVFGDDMIVPTDNVTDVIGGLEASGLKVNYRKSFWNGKFRESCGGDYFDGEWVTPIRCRRLLPSDISDTSEMVSAVSLRNQLYKAGYWWTVRFLDKYIGALAPFPAVEDTSPALGKHTFLPVQGTRECVRLHRPQIRGMLLSQRPRRSNIVDDGYACLRKWFLTLNAHPSANDGKSVFDSEDHLRFAGRPDTAHINIRWIYTY